MAESDARAKAAKLKKKARQRRKRKEAMQDTPDEDLRGSAKSKRRKLKEKGKRAGESVAGTLKSVGGAVSEKAKSAVSSVESDGADDSESMGSDDAEARESRTDTFKRGLSKIGNRLGKGGRAFAEKAKEYEPQAAEGKGDEGENDASGAAILAGAGFGGEGDPPTIVGVDQNRDGQFQRDEIAFLGPPKEAEAPEQTQQSSQPDPSVLSLGMDNDVSTEPIVPGFEGDGDPQIPMLDGTDKADDKQGEPDSDMFVGNGPRF